MQCKHRKKFKKITEQKNSYGIVQMRSQRAMSNSEYMGQEINNYSNQI